MGRFSNFLMKRLLKAEKTYSDEQKAVVSAAIDKHGPNAVRWLLGNVEDDYKLNADEMIDVLKFAESLDAISFAHARTLPNVKLYHVAKVYNDLAAPRVGAAANSLAESMQKSEGNLKLTSYEMSLFKTFYKIACSIEDMTGRDSNAQISDDLKLIKEILVDPYVEKGAIGDGFNHEKLCVLQDACSQNVNIMRLLNHNHTSLQMMFIMNAMLTQTSDELIDKICEPNLSFNEMCSIALESEDFENKFPFNFSKEEYLCALRFFNGEHSEELSLYRSEPNRVFESSEYIITAITHMNYMGNPQLTFNIHEKPVNDFFEAEYTGHYLAAFSVHTIPLSYETLCKQIDNAFKENPLTDLRLHYCQAANKTKTEYSNIDDLITRANGVSEQSKGLADDLGKLREGMEIV